MLLRLEVADDVDVLAVAGPVADEDAPTLVSAVASSWQRRPRGVVLDLADVTSLAPDAAEVLQQVAGGPADRPAGSLGLCGACPEVSRALAGFRVHRSRQEAVAHVPERRSAPRQVVPIDHSLHGPAQARRVVQQCADALGLHEEGHDLLLVVSEMVTNAVRHAAPPVALEIAATPDRVVVAVADGSAAPPRPRDADAEAEGGRGMTLVDLLCSERGVRTAPPGKTVWAAVPRGRRTGS